MARYLRYGEPRVENRHRIWSLLCDLRAQSEEPRVVMGDYNEAILQHEHMLRSARPEALGISGLPFHVR